MNKGLRYARRALAAAVGAVCLLFFLDVTFLLPVQLHGIFHIQIVPAIMAGAVGVLVVMSLVTLLLGRVYCSVICPLGILQDFVLRVKKWCLRLVKKQKRLNLKYKKPLNIVRYAVLVVVALFLAIGVSTPLLLLDPYSIFGRIANSLFVPVVVWTNNLLASVLTSMGNYSMYVISELTAQWYVAVLSVIVLAVIVVMVWRRGRLWCNSVCPVGTALGIVSNFSLFKITMNDKCSGCALCAADCKALCIDAKARTVDTSRCVGCFNCLNKCNRDAITYSPTGWKFVKKKPNMIAKEAQEPEQKVELEEQRVELSGVENSSRRRFITSAVVAAAAVPATRLFGKEHDNGEYVSVTNRTKLPMPPGAVSRERFMQKCTGCLLCVSKCPTHVLKPAFFENGIKGIMQPYMSFKLDCFCNYECKVCAEVCPNKAIVPLTIEEKKLTRVGYAHFLKDKCKVFVDDADCGACAEHCPSQAVHMVAYKDGLTIPEVNPELCIGCGGCESICPISPPAIFIQGIDTQNQAVEPTKDTFIQQEITDFGF